MIFSAFSGLKKKSTRTFNYSPRYYKPEDDPETYGRRKLGADKEAFLREEKLKKKLHEQWGITGIKQGHKVYKAGMVRLVLLLLISLVFLYIMGDVIVNFFKAFDK